MLIYNYLNIKQVGFQMRPHLLWGHIWIQLVCKSHQQSPKYATSIQRVQTQNKIFFLSDLEKFYCSCLNNAKSRAPDKERILIATISISTNSMLDHMLESSHQDDSYRWSNIGFGEEITQVLLIEVYFRHLIWCSVNH